MPLPTTECFKGLDLLDQITAIYEALRDASGDESLTTPECFKGEDARDQIADIYAAVLAISGSMDPDALDFIDRASITDSTEQYAANFIVLSLKAASLWTSIPALYPYMGGTADSHSQNLMSPSYPIVWNGGVTHNSNGVTGDGTTGYGDTGLKPFDIGADLGLSLYVRGLPTGDNNQTGCNNPSGLYIMAFDMIGADKYGFMGDGASFALQAGVPITGFYSINRTAANSLTLYRNGESIATSAVASAVAPIAVNFYVLGRNNNGVADVFSEENDAMAVFHPGLTSAQSASLFAIAQAAQILLGRAV